MADEIEVDQHISKKVDEINLHLDQFEQNNGLPPLKDVKIPKVLEMSIEDLKKKSPEELIEYSFEINQYSLYIQRLINKNKALERWAKCKSDELTAYYIPEVGNQYGYNERILMARHNHDVCRKLNKFLRRVSMEIDRLYDIPDNVRILAETVKDLRFLAIRREKQYDNDRG